MAEDETQHSRASLLIYGDTAVAEAFSSTEDAVGERRTCGEYAERTAECRNPALRGAA